MILKLINLTQSFHGISKLIIIMGILMAIVLIIGISFCIFKILFRKYFDTSIEEDDLEFILDVIQKGQFNLLVRFRKKNDFRDLLLDEIEQKNHQAFEAYKYFEFNLQDIKELKSAFWWKKLDSLLAFDIILPLITDQKSIHGIYHKIESLIDHQHPLVSTLAVKITFTNLSDDKVNSFLMKLENSEYLKEDLFLDAILDAFKTKHIALLYFLELNPNSSISKIILKVISRIKFKEASSVLERLLKNHKVTVASNLKSLVKALGALKSPHACDELVILLNHEEPSIINATLFALANIDPKKYDRNYFKSLELGTDAFEVKEVLNYLRGTHA